LPLVEEKPQRPAPRKKASFVAGGEESTHGSKFKSRKEKEKTKKDKRRNKKTGRKNQGLNALDQKEESEQEPVGNEAIEDEGNNPLNSINVADAETVGEAANKDGEQDVDVGDERRDSEDVKESGRKDQEGSEKASEHTDTTEEDGAKSVIGETKEGVKEEKSMSLDSGTVADKLSLFDANSKNPAAKAKEPRDGNEEDDEDDGYSEEDEDWEWDYGEEWEEGDEQEVEEIERKTKEASPLEEGTVQEEKSKVELRSLNPLPLERLQRGSSEREKSSDLNDDINDEEEDVMSETGTSVIGGDVEDNLEDPVKQPKRYVLPLLRRSFKPDPDHLDPHMEELCRKVRRLSVSTVEVRTKEEEAVSEALAGSKDENEGDTSVSSAEPVNGRRRLRHEWVARSLSSIAPRYQASSGECSVYSCLTQFTAPELLTGNNRWACEKCTKREAKRRAAAGFVDGETTSDAEWKGISSLDQSEGGDNEDALQSDESGIESRDSEEDGNKKSPKIVYCNASKQLLIYSPPAVLTVHLKRFQQTNFNLRKVSRHVNFPLHLDLAPFCATTALSAPNVSAGAKQIVYELTAVVEHSGRLQNGHYTACVRSRTASSAPRDVRSFLSSAAPVANNEDIVALLTEIERKCAELNSAEQETSEKPTDKQTLEDSTNEDIQFKETPLPSKWFLISDSHVSEISVDRVLKSQAYLLFYERLK